jgi:glycosyltransferase involved in cell wall biosynthesis
VRFLPLRPDVEFYYAAADAYVGPSLEDAFALPPAEAMACGLPVIVSNQAGVCEIITDGVDGLVLKDPRGAGELAGLIRRVLQDVGLRHRLGERAVQSARRYTWDRNAAETAAFLEKAMSQRDQP